MTEKTRCAFRLLDLVGGMLLLSACTTLPAIKTTPEMERLWSARQHSLDRMDFWTIAGRLGIQSEREGWNISFRWRQESKLYQIALSAPLGQQSAELRGDELGVTLALADGRRVAAADAEALLSRELGWRVPVRGLHYWVRGVPAPDEAETHALDEQGRLAWLKQSGWDISYRRYGDFSGQSLPIKIFLDNDELKVRLVIDAWTLP